MATAPVPEGDPPAVVADMTVDSDLLLKLQAITSNDERQVTTDVLRELRLPGELRVREVWVGGKQISQMQAALPEIQAALQAGDFAHLFFEKGGPVDELYLMSALQPVVNE